MANRPPRFPCVGVTTPFATAVFVFTGIVALSCSSTTPVAEITPVVESACSVAEVELSALAEETPTSETASTAAAHLFEILRAMPDAETDVGRPGSVVGDHVQALRNDLSAIQTATRLGDPSFSAEERAADMRRSFTELNDGTNQFGVNSCLSQDVLELVLVPHVDVVAAAVAARAPTGDFDVDIVAVCTRFDDGLRGLFDNNTGRGLGYLVIPTGLAQLASDLVFDLELLEPPSDRVAEVAQLSETAEGVRREIINVQSIRTGIEPSQERFDAARDRLDDLGSELERQLSALHPDC